MAPRAPGTRPGGRASSRSSVPGTTRPRSTSRPACSGRRCSCPCRSCSTAGSGDGVEWLLTEALAGTGRDAPSSPLRSRTDGSDPRPRARRHPRACPRRAVPVRLPRRPPRSRTPGSGCAAASRPASRPASRVRGISRWTPRSPSSKGSGPPSEDLVVCHGDYCFPNVLLDDAGAITGFLDLGELAVADRWWDVAVGRVEHNVERRARLRGVVLRRLRHRARRRSHRVLPLALRPCVVTTH